MSLCEMLAWAFGLGVIVLTLAGCSSTFTPEMIEALAKDSASFCAQSDIRGGAGTIMAPSGGYGQSTLSFCRSNQKEAKVSIAPDGAISIEHGSHLKPVQARMQ